jgi:hypothetical protein
MQAWPSFKDPLYWTYEKYDTDPTTPPLTRD